MRTNLISPCLAALAAGLALPAQAAPGDLDPAFGMGQLALTSISDRDVPRAMAVQPDGRIVVVGYSNIDRSNARNDIALVRFNADGSLDDGGASDSTPADSFGNGGKVTTTIGSGSATASTVAVQADGRIIAAGTSIIDDLPASSKFVIVRYTKDGALDTSFNGTGKVTTSFSEPSSYDNVRDVAVQPDGKIVAVGEADRKFAVVRYNTDGSLDSSFNGTGKVLTTITGVELCGALGVALQSDGRILVTGYSANGSDADFAVARYHIDGSLDLSFNGTGRVLAGNPGKNDQSTCIALQHDGRIVMAGYQLTPGTGSDFKVVRLNPDGSPDDSFNGTGMVVTPLGPEGNAFGVAVQSDGKIVVAGGASLDFALVRYRADGSMDATFNGTGIVKTDVAGRRDEIRGVVVLNDGKVVVGGSANDGTIFVFAAARYHADGRFDESFNHLPGKVTTSVNSSSTAAGVTLQSDGRIVVVGTASSASVSEFAVARYTSTGALDPDFNVTGKVTTDLASAEDAARSVAVQSDGRIVVAGYSFDGSDYDFALVRYTHAGALDTTFNGTGIVRTDFGSNLDIGQSVAVQNDGKMVVAGYSGADYALARYNPDGSLDSTFSGDGKQTTNISGSDMARSMAVQSDGKIVLAGSSDPPGGLTPRRFSAARYNVDGSLDTSFNGTGYVTTPVGGMHSGGANIAIQCDGRIVVVGFAGPAEGGGSLAIVRYTPAGALDTGFNGTGIVIDDLDGQFMEASGVALQADGKIVVAGTSNLDFALVRYTSGGVLDLGPVTTNITTIGSGPNTQTSHDTGSSVAIQNDGKIVLAGTAAIPAGSTDFAVVRYESDTPRQMFDNVAAAAGLTGPDADPNATPFHDGVGNLVKYAFRMNLAAPDVRTLHPGGSTGLATAQLIDVGGLPHWRVEFARLKGSGLIYTPLKSTTLDPNSFVPMTGAITVENIDAQCERVIVSEPLDPGATRFINRVQVTLPP